MYRNTTRELFRLGWPMFIGQLAVMGNGAIDTVMAGRYSTLDLAAVGIGASIYASVFVTMMGVLLALSPITAQLYGAGKYAEIGEEVRQTGWLTLMLALVSVAILRHPEPLLAISRLTPEVEVRVRGYLDALSWSVPAALLFRVFYGLSTAVSRPRAVMTLNLIGLALKIPFNWVFMYGNLGVPAMGSVGCGVATAFIAWISCALAWTWCYAESDYRRYKVFAVFSWPKWREIGRILALGLPIGVTFLVDVTGFTFMALFIARLGPTSSGAHQIAANMAALAYMLPLAIGNATSVLVGHAIGAKRYRLARSAGVTGLAIGVACSGSAGLLLFLNAGTIADLYSNDTGVRQLAATLLAFVGCYHIFDGMQAVTSGALRGYKHTLVPMVVYAFALWGLGLGGGYVLGLTRLGAAWLPFVTPLGARGFWLAAILSLVICSIIVTSYFLAVSHSAMKLHGDAVENSPPESGEAGIS
jgi:multidrug resistance protein, MATE family